MAEKYPFEHVPYAEQYYDYAIKNQDPITEQNLNKWTTEIKHELDDVFNKFQVMQGREPMRFSTATIYKPGSIISFQGRKFVALRETIVTAPLDDNNPNWIKTWHEILDDSEIVEFGVNTVLSKNNEEPFEPENDYNPATKKYVDDLRHSLEEDGEDLSTKITVANSDRVGGFKLKDLTKKTDFNRLDKAAIKKTDLIDNLDVDPDVLKNTSINGVKAKEIDDRIKDIENYFDLKNNKIKFNNYNDLIDKINLILKTNGSNLTIDDIVGLKNKLDEIDDTTKLLDNNIKNNQAIQSIDLRDTTKKTLDAEKTSPASASIARDLYEQLNKIKILLDTSGTDLKSFKDIIKEIKANKSIIDQLKEIGVGSSNLASLIDKNNVNNTKSIKTLKDDLDIKIDNIIKTLNEKVSNTEFEKLDKQTVRIDRFIPDESGRYDIGSNNKTFNNVYSETINTKNVYSDKFIRTIFNNTEIKFGKPVVFEGEYIKEYTEDDKGKKVWGVVYNCTPSKAGDNVIGYNIDVLIKGRIIIDLESPEPDQYPVNTYMNADNTFTKEYNPLISMGYIIKKDDKQAVIEISL